MRKNDSVIRIAVILLLVIAFFLRVYRLDDLMPFIGDFAWFYISARDMILTGEIPLVGITSSHTWVHQGPLWTYILAAPLLISGFNPLSGAYFTAVMGTITVFFMYKIGVQMFSRFVGLSAAAVYATSPFAIIHSRMPYHTSLIPLVSLFFIYFLYKWMRGDVRFFPLVIFALAILYNLELATTFFWILLLLVCVYGLVKGKTWFQKTIKPKIIFKSILLLFFAMIPMIVYDFRENSGFYQTTAILRIIKIYLFYPSGNFSLDAIISLFPSLFVYNQRLVFLMNGITAFLITLASFFYLSILIYQKKDLSLYLLALWITIPICGILIGRTASEAYLPMIFPAIILSVVLLFSYIYKRHILAAILFILFTITVNSYMLVSSNYFMGISSGYGLPYSERVSIVNEIIKKSKGRDYNLIGKGEGSEHKSFTMNYEYLIWWMGGHPPSKKIEALKFIIDK